MSTSDTGKLIATLRKDAPTDEYHREDHDFDQKMWYRDLCHEAADALGTLQNRESELTDLLRRLADEAFRPMVDCGTEQSLMDEVKKLVGE